jgi:uncharacterized tellurite resistance protein B-like protein
MGLFSKTRKRDGALTPRLSMAIGMTYATAADGYLSETERFDLHKVIPDDDLLEEALDYTRRTSTVDFLAACKALLTHEQKLCLLLNMIDVSMSDGKLQGEERDLLTEFQNAFAISDALLEPHLVTLTLKNDRRAFAEGGA